MKRNRLRFMLATVGLAVTAVATSCVATAWVPAGPPAAQVEIQGVAPGPGFVWINGWWGWHGDWRWHRGFWGRRPTPYATWVAPQWRHEQRGWRMTPGHWRY